MLRPENVRDYPRPPALEPVDEMVRVVFAGRDLARSEGALRILETFHAPTYYIPPADVAMERLVPVARQTVCEWKGVARYYDIVDGARQAPAAAWSYPQPTGPYAALKDHVAIYATAVDAAYVGNVQVIPQPGDFYGGWVTPNLTGPIKGAPGTRHW